MKRMKRMKQIAVVIIMVMIFYTMAIPVYAGKAKLSAPAKFEACLDGDTYFIFWEEISGAAGYECVLERKTKNYTATVKDNYVSLKISDEEKATGLLAGTISVRALPASSDKKHAASDYSTRRFSKVPVSHNDVVNPIEKRFLSKEELLVSLSQQKNPYNEYDEGDYTKVVLTVKDSNNSGILNAAQAILGGAFSGAGQEVVDNLDNIGKYSIENSDGFDDMKEKSYEKMTDYGKKGAVVGGANAAADYLSKDKNQYFRYFYRPKEGYRSCTYMEYNYLKSGNDTPKQLFEKWGYNYSDDGYYYKLYDKINLYTVGTYREDGDRYTIMLEKKYPKV